MFVIAAISLARFVEHPHVQVSTIYVCPASCLLFDRVKRFVDFIIFVSGAN